MKEKTQRNIVNEGTVRQTECKKERRNTEVGYSKSLR